MERSNLKKQKKNLNDVSLFFASCFNFFSFLNLNERLKEYFSQIGIYLHVRKQ